jgi:hypothetical protein
MSKQNGSSDKDSDDVLPAIWILSCNDENPIITYKGIAVRIGVTEGDAQRLVGTHRELFRPGIRPHRLNAWKERLKVGKGLPGWLLEITDHLERNKAIDALSPQDVFRNQFRVEDGAPKCSIEIIDWGLKHLDMIGSRAATVREEKIKKWGTVILPLCAILVSLIVALAAQAMQWKTTNDLRALKFYEVNFKPKQENYTAFMSAFNEAALACASADNQKALIQINRMESAYFALDPFFDDESRKSIFSKYSEFSKLCETQSRRPALIGSDWKDVDRDAYQKLILEMSSLKQFFRENLFKSLFGKDVI